MRRRRKSGVSSGEPNQGRKPETPCRTSGLRDVAGDANRSGRGKSRVAQVVQRLGTQNCLFAFALIVVVFLAYQPAWNGGFVWDDDLHLLNNPVLKPGGIGKIWVPGNFANYWPLTSSVYWLEYEMWGLDPFGFHMVNIALHVISAILLWRVLTCLRIPGAMFAAALFALHPVNVESVAWITQLKNTLSLTLTLVSVLLYLQHEQQGGTRRYVLSLVVFFLSTLAKGMVLTLPVVLVACDWWQRGRIGRRDVLRVLPYILIGLPMVGIEIVMQHADLGVRSDGLVSRVAVAGCGVWFYLWKAIWPVNLSFVYPRWNIEEQSILSFLPGALLVVVFVCAWWQRRTWGRPVVMFMVCYVAMLLPALGLVNIYFMKYSLVADHWQYAALTAPCAMLGGMVVALARRRPKQSWCCYTVFFAVLACFTGLTCRQSRMYRDVETLYRTTIDSNPNCWMANYNLGLFLAKRGQLDEATRLCQRTLEIKPDHIEAYKSLGALLCQRKQFEPAIAEFRKLLKIDPDCAEAYFDIAATLVACNKVDEAIANYRKAIAVDPEYVDAYVNLGAVLTKCGRVDEAIACYRKAVDIRPDYAKAHNSLGAVLAGQRQVDEALVQFHKALELKPDYAAAHNNLGMVLAGRNEFDEAITHYQAALKAEPDYSDAHNNLGIALARCGQVDGAIVHFRKALSGRHEDVGIQNNLCMAMTRREQLAQAVVGYKHALQIEPDDTGALAKLAWLRASCPEPSFRNSWEAVELAERLQRLSNGQDPNVLNILAAAYAEAGRFREATEAAKRGLELAIQHKNTALADALRIRIGLYESGSPYRDIPPPASSTQPKQNK
jgi:protein O-mannosyl-transferase